MAKKYIDADLLRKEIEKRKNICNGVYERDSDTYYQGKAVAYQETLSLIDSLQQEQTLTDCNELQEPEVDLEKEVEKYFQGLWPGMETAEQCNTDMHFTPPAIMRLARHFANWQKEQMIRIAKNRYEQAMTFVSGNLDVDHALQMDRLALVKIIEEGEE